MFFNCQRQEYKFVKICKYYAIVCKRTLCTLTRVYTPAGSPAGGSYRKPDRQLLLRMLYIQAYITMLNAGL